MANKDMPELLRKLIELGLQQTLQWLLDRIEKLEAATAKPSSSAPRQTKGEEEKGVSRG